MMGPSHRLFGALFGAGFASLAGADTPTMVAATLISTAMSYGNSSPDMDQDAGWKEISSKTGMGWLLAHRHLTHWWGIPLALAWPITAIDPAQQWPFWALWLGWVSHLVGDFIFGKLPLLPWGGVWLGIGLKTDGLLEHAFLGISLLRTAITVGIIAFYVGRPTWAQALDVLTFWN